MDEDDVVVRVKITRKMHIFIVKILKIIVKEKKTTCNLNSEKTNFIKNMNRMEKVNM